ncbi:cell surface protein [Listeria kieliensis]|uniref:Cell surface protein n=1 Tax=Listeria kieliensis TaxID=1621700 RepID=A0A3D8TRM1_9LIST|nr:cell surface protein [Listeria kieliensis]
MASCLILFGGGVIANAESSMGFSVNTILPTNQVDKTKIYFDLEMKPGQVQELSVVLTNAKNKAITIENHANTAITNDNGIVDYSQASPKLDRTLKYPFSKLAEVEQTTTIPAHGQKTVKIKVTMPKESFDGIVLGGLHFKEQESKKQKTKNDENVQIENRYAYVIGVRLVETKKTVQPDLKLNAIKPSQINYRNVLKANLQNTKPVIIQDFKVDAKVTKRGKDQVLFQEKKENMRIAPNSNFNYGINWNNQEFKPDKYTLHLTAWGSGKKWTFTKNFEIKRDEAAKWNNKAVELERDYTMWYVIGGVILVLLLLIGVYVLGRKSRKKKEEE